MTAKVVPLNECQAKWCGAAATLAVYSTEWTHMRVQVCPRHIGWGKQRIAEMEAS